MAYVACSAVYIAVLLSERQPAGKHLSEPHAVAIRKWNALLPHEGRGAYVYIPKARVSWKLQR